jgi:prepilin-type N-terminal cleavage/methylation domain-containing protein
MQIFKNTKGFTLLEIMIALAIISMVLMTAVSFLPSIISWGDQNDIRYQAVNIATDLERQLLEGEIVPQFQPGWKWEEEREPFQITISYVGIAQTKDNHHVFEINVRWGSDWRTPGKVTTKTILIENVASP